MKAQKQTDKKHFVVIADVKNAFGSILHDKMEKILKYVNAKLPPELYLYKLRYHYPNAAKKKVVFKTILHPKSDLNVMKDLPRNGCHFITNDGVKKINVKRSLMTIAKRIRSQCGNMRIFLLLRFYVKSMNSYFLTVNCQFWVHSQF